LHSPPCGTSPGAASIPRRGMQWRPMSVCKSLSSGGGVNFYASPSISHAFTAWALLLLSAVVSIVWDVCSWWFSSCISRSPRFWCSVSVCGTSPGEASIPRRGSSGGLCRQVIRGCLSVVSIPLLHFHLSGVCWAGPAAIYFNFLVSILVVCFFTRLSLAVMPMH